MQAYPTWQRDSRSVAIHEAAHLVAGHHLGVPQTEAQIAPSGETGVVLVPPLPEHLPEFDDASMRLAALCAAAWYYAGYEGELLYHAAERPTDYLWSWTKDHRCAEAALLVAFDDAALAGDAQEMARSILIEHWAQVLSVADKLERTGTVSIAEVDQLAARMN